MLIKLLRQYGRPYIPYIIAVFVFQLASTIAALYLPSLNAQIIDQGVAKADTDFIWRVGGVMLIVALVQVIAAIAGVYYGSKAAMAVGRDLRRGVFRKVTAFSAQELGSFGAPTLITRGTNDIQQVQMVLLVGLNFMVTTPIMCIGGIIMALREDLSLSWLVWVSVPLLVVVVGYLVYLLMPLFKSMQAKIDKINGVLREQIVGIRVVRAFVREPYETKRFDAANDDLTKVSLKVGAIFVLMFPLITMILHIATSAVLWFGGQRVDAGQMQIGSLTAFLQYLLQILTAVMMGTLMAMMIPRAVVCAERIGEVLDVEPTIHMAPTPTEPAAKRGEVEYRNVSFSYPGAEAPVLKDISFTASPGQTVAIIGATGVGKTTLLSLLPRLYNVASGEVLLDGVPVTELSRKAITSRVSMVPQKPYLVSGTIESNLRFGKPNADDAELWDALTVAQGADFVREKSKGLESRVAQGGTNVSGGQRQRLCIARTLVAEPKVYLFDDSFSALDVATDARLRKAPKEKTADATVIIVAQRVTTITEADQILVLDDGAIVDRGTHDELLASSETYQEIVASYDQRGGCSMSEQPKDKRKSRRRGKEVEAPQASAETAVLEDDDDFVEEEYKPTEADGDMFGGAPAKKAKAFWPSAKRLVGLLRHEWLALVAIFAAVAISVVLTVIGPKILGKAMDVIFNGVIGTGLPANPTKEQVIAGARAQGNNNFADMLATSEVVPGHGIDFNALSYLILVVLSIYFIASVFNWFQGYLLNRIVMKAIRKLRSDVEAKLNRLPLNYFDTGQRGDVLSRVTNDVDNVQQGLQQAFSQLVSSILLLVGFTVMMFLVSWQLALIALIAIPLSGVVAGVIGSRSQKLFAAQWKTTGAFNGQIEESFSGHTLVTLFGHEEDMLERFDERNEELYKASFG
ncbi:multidrug resistance ABC transporter ATP-binding and permease protein [Renibacterium salmoninarum ATCC 33209]|uniref:Multidrug resistance ABC transporter ATP-binding and permease protein n=1 Tax=Renibacterium salmoninarum (strain ATCC 33209 / DSM 20767 / JCM 11484 / NBRC 15589 / NCIMB 2235) TaxID=288705 RepID=A9WKV1_RENSM|nr:multidrug resistance ABC transporter ATP-binding and permease protein [Renibacterium salmoninarum ATCC 33209]